MVFGRHLLTEFNCACMALLGACGSSNDGGPCSDATQITFNVSQGSDCDVTLASGTQTAVYRVYAASDAGLGDVDGSASVLHGAGACSVVSGPSPGNCFRGSWGAYLGFYGPALRSFLGGAKFTLTVQCGGTKVIDAQPSVVAVDCP